MTTRIYVSSKIQKSYKKLTLNDLPEKSGMLEHENSWNANYVPMFGKKCWIVTHTITRYTVIIPDVKAKNIEHFQSIFRENMINQLIKKYLINPDNVKEFIGEVKFYPTNGDRSTIAYNNQRMQDVSYWRYEFDSFEKIPFYKIGSNINELGTRPNNGKLIYIDPSEEFLKWINSSHPFPLLSSKNLLPFWG
jgi:hypothetical protein